MQATAAQRAAAAALPALCDDGFSAAVIAWQRQHGRHALPWQSTRDAYRIWLSEIMLQQTQVAAVIAYYEKFLRSFPTVEALAAAPTEQVMAHWSGLGYYTRARNLHACAKRVVAEYGGHFPRDPVALAELPGIGRSTAAAIAAFAYGVRAAILDGNVKRVLCRVYGIEGFPGSRAIEVALWQRAEALLPPATGHLGATSAAYVGEVVDGYADANAVVSAAANGSASAMNVAGGALAISSYTQGLMDLGATLCTRNRPQCSRCPLALRCVALATGRTAVLPERRIKKPVPERHTTMLLCVFQGQVLLEQRPDKGIWGGLLSLPEIAVCAAPSDDDVAHHEAQISRLVEQIGTVSDQALLTSFSHGFTHFRLHITPRLIRLAEIGSANFPANAAWYDSAGLAHAALPAPVKKLLLDFFGGADRLPGFA